MAEPTIRQACKQLMQTEDLVYVSTIDEQGYAQTRALYNLHNLRLYTRLIDFFQKEKNEFIAYLVTNRASDKIKQLEKNPRICLYYCSFPAVHGLALIGEARVVEDKQIRHALWQDEWNQFYVGGVDGLDYTVLRVDPIQAKGWYKTDKFAFRID
jgi:general stress protein 26